MRDIKKIEKHLLTHPSDYQSVIALYKLRSKEIDKGRKRRSIDKRKLVSEWRKRLEQA